MPDRSKVAPPIPARAPTEARNHGIDGVSLLTVYLVLLLAIPSSVIITALGSLGRPSVLWGLVLFVWWALARLQVRSVEAAGIPQPVRLAFCALLVVALLSFAVALLRGQPADQVSPAFTAILRFLSWGGVFLVAVDGVRSLGDVERVVRRLVIGVGMVAALGIAQVVSGHPIIDFFTQLPGLSGGDGTIAERGGQLRVSGTAIHPLEFATALNCVFPLAVATALSHGFTGASTRHRLAWWLPVVVIAVCSAVGVSRSAVIGFLLAVALMVPVLPRGYRLPVIGGGVLLIGAVIAVAPGLLGTTLGLFQGATTDPSTLSRVRGVDRIPEFLSASPWLGVGSGTFLPRYYIFDDQWLLMLVELGLVGLAAFAALFVAAIFSALSARRRSVVPQTRLVAYSLAASIVVVGVLFAFFDGLGFPISAGILFLLAGLCGSIRTAVLTEGGYRPADPVTT